MYAVVITHSVYDNRDGLCGSVRLFHSLHYTQAWAFEIASRLDCSDESTTEVINLETGHRCWNPKWALSPIEYSCANNPELIPF